jgi:hypothetical protein
MALLYADENFDAGVTAELRRLGHDVRSVQEAGRQVGNRTHGRSAPWHGAQRLQTPRIAMASGSWLWMKLMPRFLRRSGW